MDSYRDEYTIFPETGQKIKLGTQTWKRLASKYYTIDRKFTDQPIPDSRAYLSNKVLGVKEVIPTRRVTHRRVSDPKGERKYLIVGSKAWNERFLEYEWNGHEFGDKRGRPLPETMYTVEKRREARRSKFFARFDRKVSEGRLSDVINSSLGYALMYYHTADGDMYKEWVKEKRTKKDFRLNNDDDNRLWVRLPDRKSEEEVEPINLVFDETDEFNEIVKNFIIKGMREYNQCFVTIMAYNLMWTHAGDPKILNLTDDRLGHLRIVRQDRIDEWIEVYRKWYRNAVEEQETEGSDFVYIGWIGFHIEMFPLWTFVGYKHHTPSIIGQTVVNPNIDDNRCLQRCLILASEGGHKIVANCKIGDASVYNKWWKQPDKYKVFGVTIHEVEEAMGIRDNKSFEQSEEKFAALEALLKVSLNVFEVTLLPGYIDKGKEQFDLFSVLSTTRLRVFCCHYKHY